MTIPTDHQSSDGTTDGGSAPVSGTDRAPGSGADRITGASRWLLGATVLMLGAVAIRVAQLKSLPDSRLAPAMGSRTSTSPELNARGRILDRKGRILATSSVGYRLYADPAMIWERGWQAAEKAKALEPDSEAECDPFRDLASALGSTAGFEPLSVLGTLRERADDRYVVLSKQLEPWQVEQVRQLDLEGIGLEPRLVRHYPQGETAALLVGKVGGEQTGLSGMELRHERSLAATKGHLTYLRDVHRNTLFVEEGKYQPGRDGKDLVLSIDLVVQDMVERRLDQAVRDVNAGGGRAVVLDPHTGDVLAMADILRSRSGWNEITTDPNRARDAALGRNRCVTDPYEPGSTFKQFVWAWATKHGIFKPTDRLPTPPGHYVTPYGRTVRDVHPVARADWRTVLVKSLNAGMAISAERLTHDQMQDCVRAFGFGTSTGVGVPGEIGGLVTSPGAWSKYTQTSVSMGHEIGVTAVQMVRAFSVFCREDGMLPNVRVAQGTNDPSTMQLPVIPPRIALEARSAMEGVLTEGTARGAKSSLYRMFGKTGTAQLPKPKGQGKGYYDDRYVSSFIVGAPFEQPRLVVLVVIDDPDRKIKHFGGSVAGPAARDIMEGALQYLGVAPDQPDAPKPMARAD